MSQQRFTVDLTLENRGVPVRLDVVEAGIRNWVARAFLQVVDLEVNEEHDGLEAE